MKTLKRRNKSLKEITGDKKEQCVLFIFILVIRFTKLNVLKFWKVRIYSNYIYSMTSFHLLTCLCSCVWRPAVHSGVVLNHLHHFLGQRLSLNLDPMDSAKLTGQGSEETFLSLPPRGITDRCCHSWPQIGVGIKFRSSCLCNHQFTVTVNLGCHPDWIWSQIADKLLDTLVKDVPDQWEDPPEMWAVHTHTHKGRRD